MMPGPRIYASGAFLGQTGGHADTGSFDHVPGDADDLQALKELEGLVTDHALCLNDPEPDIFIGELGDGSVCWGLTAQAKGRFDTKGTSIRGTCIFISLHSKMVHDAPYQLRKSFRRPMSTVRPCSALCDEATRLPLGRPCVTGGGQHCWLKERHT